MERKRVPYWALALRSIEIRGADFWRRFFRNACNMD
jgi:hypothetical protein